MRLLVHPLDEGRGAAVRDARERAGGGVVGRDERQVQDVVERDSLVRSEIGRRRGVDVAALDGDFPREIRLALEEHERGHDLGDARDRALVLRVLFPEHLAGLRVEDDRRRGADIRHERAGRRVGLVSRGHRLLQDADARQLPCPGGSAGTGQAGPPGLRGGGGIDGLANRRCPGLRRALLGRFSRNCRERHTQTEQQGGGNSSHGHDRDHTHEPSVTTAADWGQPAQEKWMSVSLATTPTFCNHFCNSADALCGGFHVRAPQFAPLSRSPSRRVPQPYPCPARTSFRMAMPGFAFRATNGPRRGTLAPSAAGFCHA